jgi:hypothetical protein
MMSLIHKPIVVPPDMTLRRAADKLRGAAEDIALERCGASALLQIAHQRVADALDVLADDCFSTTQLPTSEEARAFWASHDLPRLEIKNVGCLVVPPLPRLPGQSVR